jgi:hypothetical protein
MSKENKFLIRRYLEECLAKNDMSLLNELLVADYVLHDPLWGNSTFRRASDSSLRCWPHFLMDIG